MNSIHPNRDIKVGILGDGQLALMLVEATSRLGSIKNSEKTISVYGPDRDSPISKKFPELHLNGTYHNSKKLQDFCHSCDVIILENEFIQSEMLKKIFVNNISHTKLIPSLSSYEHFSNKTKQFLFFESLEIPIPSWELVDSKKPLDEIIDHLEKTFFYPLVIKKSSLGYDGMGVKVAKNKSELGEILEKFSWQSCSIIVQKFLYLKAECAQGFIFDGEHITFLPLVQTWQDNGICHMTSSTHSFSRKVYEKISTYMDCLASTKLRGMFHFEFFITHDDDVYINEGAPRPHNSQHLTMDACEESQFDLLMKMAFGLKLATKTLIALPAVMVNILGKRESENYQLKLPQLPEGVKIYPKLYEKKSSRKGRKMGHVNIIETTIDAATSLPLLGEKLFSEYEL